MAIQVIRELVTRFTAKTDKKSVDGAQKAIDGLAKSAMKLGNTLSAAVAGAAVVSGLRNLVSESVAFGDQLDKLSLQTGVGVKQLQQLKFAAEQQGVSFENSASAIRELQQNLASAKLGKGAAVEDLARLGIDASTALQDIPNAILDISDRIKDLDAGEQQRVSKALFGGSGSEFVKFLKLGSSGIAELNKEAMALGGGFSEQAIKASAGLSDAFNRVSLAVKSATGDFVEQFFPAMIKFANRFAKLISESRALKKVIDAIGVSLAWFFNFIEGALNILSSSLNFIFDMMSSIFGETGEWAVAIGLVASAAAVVGGIFSNIFSLVSGVFPILSKMAAVFIPFLKPLLLAVGAFLIIEDLVKTIINMFNGTDLSQTLLGKGLLAAGKFFGFGDDKGANTNTISPSSNVQNSDNRNTTTITINQDVSNQGLGPQEAQEAADRSVNGISDLFNNQLRGTAINFAAGGA